MKGIIVMLTHFASLTLLTGNGSLVRAGAFNSVAADDAAAPTGRFLNPPEQGATLEELWNDGDFTEGVAVAPDGRSLFQRHLPRGSSRADLEV